MRVSVFGLIVFAAVTAIGQDSHRVTSVYDASGRAVEWTKASTGQGRSVESVQTLNGRSVPLEKIEEKVIKNEGGVRIVEKTVRRNDSSGNPLPPEKVVLEETTAPDGSVKAKTSLYRGDINGRLVLAERVTQETRKTASGSESTALVERPTLNGTVEVLEKREGRTTASGDTTEALESVFRKDANGRFTEGAKQVIRTTKKGSETVEQADYFEASTGEMRLSRQQVSRSIQSADGSVVKVVDLYGAAAPGRPDSGKMQLRERQLFETQKTADGAVETFSVQRPKPDGRGDLQPAAKISETVCKGKCS
jgi:hypothetical protein